MKQHLCYVLNHNVLSETQMSLDRKDLLKTSPMLNKGHAFAQLLTVTTYTGTATGSLGTRQNSKCLRQVQSNQCLLQRKHLCLYADWRSWMEREQNDELRRCGNWSITDDKSNKIKLKKKKKGEKNSIDVSCHKRKKLRTSRCNEKKKVCCE